MATTRSTQWLKRSIVASTLGALLVGALPPTDTVRAAPWSKAREFASPRFEQVWRDADQAVAEGRSNRSWTWGPGPWFDYKEFYQQSPNGLRQVQYFDKARMEINNSNSTIGPLGGVTNGLLPVEMVSGRVKLGDGTGADQNEQREPAALPVAGDPLYDNPNAPTYASFRTVATTDNGYKDPNKLGQRVGATLGQDGSIGFRQDLADQAGMDIVVYESVTGHNVPRVFNDFRNSGPVPAIVAFGLPITDAYWVRTNVGGQDKDVLVQIFERRVITYTPSNPRAFQVEMGNVGQHYFLWRYGHLRNAWNPTYGIPTPLYFASRQSGPEFQIVQHNPENGALLPIYGNGNVEAVPFSVARNYSGATFVYGDTKANSYRQLIAQNYLSGRFNGLYTGETYTNDYNAAVSPDGNKVIFASDRDGNAELYLLNQGGRVAKLTETEGCTNQYPSWLPDGSGFVYESNCVGGSFEIHKATLNYNADSSQTLTVARISPSDGSRLTTNNSDDRFPRVSPDGYQIAFTANRDGNSEIYQMSIDGGQQRRVTDDPSLDQAPSWNSDGTEIVYASNLDGDFDIYKMRLSDGYVTQLTQNKVEDNWPVWAK